MYVDDSSPGAITASGRVESTLPPAQAPPDTPTPLPESSAAALANKDETISAAETTAAADGSA